MNALPHQPWLRTAVLVGAGYLVIGRVFTLPTTNVHVWRVVAWFLSGVAFIAHMRYELWWLRNSPRRSAVHVALGVAIGAVALALAGMVYNLSNGSGLRPAWLLALALWPAVTAVPAFLVALGAGALLARLRSG